MSHVTLFLSRLTVEPRRDACALGYGSSSIGNQQSRAAGRRQQLHGSSATNHGRRQAITANAATNEGTETARKYYLKMIASVLNNFTSPHKQLMALVFTFADLGE
jgi:hypothetical protein